MIHEIDESPAPGRDAVEPSVRPVLRLPGPDVVGESDEVVALGDAQYTADDDEAAQIEQELVLIRQGTVYRLDGVFHQLFTE